MERFMRVTQLVEHVHDLAIDSKAMFAVFCVIAAFGFLNCILGYRLLRFWMMLGGAALGAAGGWFLADTLQIADKTYYMLMIAGPGLVVGVLTFFVYKIGIFAIGAGIGLISSIYVLHPMSSSVFFLCLLIGVGAGVLAAKFSREVIIAATSLFGGLLCGLGIAKLGGLADLPYGIGIGVAAFLIGMLIQFAFNKPEETEEETEELQEERV